MRIRFFNLESLKIGDIEILTLNLLLDAAISADIASILKYIIEKSGDLIVRLEC